nr:uncharacterized mitochondrial protein AtMg00810-like [Tanacetum cinerariifolium]
MASKQFSLEPGLSNLNKTGKSSNPSVSQVSETSKKDLEDLFHNFYNDYFDSSKIMKSSTMNVETSNVEIPSQEDEVFHESSESFQEESSSSSLNDDVQQSPKEVILPETNTQSIANDMILNVDEASTSHNVFNKHLEDAYFDASTSFHDLSDVHFFYQPYPHEKKWTKDHPLHKIISDSKLSVCTRGQLANLCLFSCLLSFIEPDNVAEALRDADWVSAIQDELDQFSRLKVWRLVPRPEDKTIIKTKWIFKNRKDESSLVIQNKARLVAVGSLNKKALIMMRCLLQLIKLKLYACSWHMLLIRILPSFKWMPDIMFATCMCARYQANPNEHHVSTIKRIFHYLKRTINSGLWYPKDSGFDLTAYSDANHAGCHLDRISTSVSVQFLGDKLVCWSSKKQNCVSISTAGSKYVAVSGCCAQVLWMHTQLTDYGFFYDKVPIYYDSKSAIAISCNPVQHTHTKHIDVRTIIDLPRSLPSNLGKLSLGDGVYGVNQHVSNAKRTHHGPSDANTQPLLATQQQQVFEIYIQDQVQGQRFHARLIKIQVAQKKVKIAFENADSRSRVKLIPSKIKYANKVVINFHKEFSVFLSCKEKENDRLLQNQVFKNKEEVIVKNT